MSKASWSRGLSSVTSLLYIGICTTRLQFSFHLIWINFIEFDCWYIADDKLVSVAFTRIYFRNERFYLWNVIYTQLPSPLQFKWLTKTKPLNSASLNARYIYLYRLTIITFYSNIVNILLQFHINLESSKKCLCSVIGNKPQSVCK